MTTIFRIQGGFQRVQQLAQQGKTIPVIKEQSDWPEKANASAQHQYTNAWDTVYEDLVKEASEWCPNYDLKFTIVK